MWLGMSSRMVTASHCQNLNGIVQVHLSLGKFIRKSHPPNVAETIMTHNVLAEWVHLVFVTLVVMTKCFSQHIANAKRIMSLVPVTRAWRSTCVFLARLHPTTRRSMRVSSNGMLVLTFLLNVDSNNSNNLNGKDP